MESTSYQPGKQPSLPKSPYRGIRALRYADRNVFSARDWEKKQMLNLVSLFRGSLLFGQSGIGKSSLINAGLIPVLIDHDFNPEILRISPSRNGTFIVYRIVENDLEDRYLPSIFDADDEGKGQVSVSFDHFREKISSLRSGSPGDTGQATVFIFDQFEELITLFEEVSGSTTDGGLGLQDRRLFQQELIAFFRECYYDHTLRIKFIFVFREDYLAKFSRLFAAIPDLRQQSLRIKGIPVTDLRKIISAPFNQTDAQGYYANPFGKELTDLLTERFEKYFQEEVILTDLQIVCQYLYETEPGKRMALLHEDGTKSPITEIIRLYYEKSLHNISPSDKPLAIEIMQLLVLNESTRNIYHREAIEQALAADGAFTAERTRVMLEKLEHETRLIRSERRAGGQYYEINSESLIPYINRLKREKEQGQLRLAKERKNRRRLITMGIFVAAVIVLAALFIQNRIARTNYAETYILAARNAWNPTLAYLIARNAFGGKSVPDVMERYLEGVESKTGFFRTSSLYLNTDVRQAFFKGTDTIGIIEERSIRYFDKMGLLLSEIRFPEASVILQANTQACYLLLDNKDNTYTYQKFDGTSAFTVRATMSENESAIAPDGKTFVLMGTIWRAGNPRPAGKITGDMDQVFFTHDSKHIIARSEFSIYRYSQGGVKEKFDYNTPLVEAQDVSISFDDRFLVTTDMFGHHPEFIAFADSKKVAAGHDLSESSVRDPDGKEGRTVAEKSGNAMMGTVVPSPDNKIVIGMKGEEAIIWGFDGLKMGSLKADGIISGLAFSSDGKQVVTWTRDGKIFTWKKGRLSDLYAWDELVDFSPFEYAKAGLWDYTVDQAYAQGGKSKDTETVQELLARVLNYAGSLPPSNDQPDNPDYTALLRRSIHDVSVLYRRVLRPAAFESLPALQRKQLCLKYADFKTDSLYISGNSEDSKARMDAYLEGLRWKFKAAQYDQHHNETLFDLVDSYQNLAYSYIPAYHKSAEATKEAISLLKRAKPGEGTTKLLAECYGSLSYYRLFTKDFKGAVAAAREGLRQDAGQKWIYTNLALGLLLDGQTAEARNIYARHQDLTISFMEDIQELMEAGVITSQTKNYDEVLKVRRMLEGK